MIELIFVIVILGILAAVAIPRLAATRDDAKIATASADIGTLYSDLGANYTGAGQFGDMNKTTSGALTATGLKQITNVPGVYLDGTSSGGAATIQYRTDNNATVCVTLNLTYDGNVTLDANTSKQNNPSGAICTELLKVKSVSDLIGTARSFGGKKVTF